jgi:hypothetical protein
MSDKESEYNSSDDITPEEEYILEKWETIKHYTIQDYMKCHETKQLLIEHWEERFNKQLEEKILEVFKYHFEYLKGNCSNVLYRADEIHGNDLLCLVKHHLVKDYSLDIFKDNPDLADPLVKLYENNYDVEHHDKKLLHKKFKAANKIYNWGK